MFKSIRNHRLFKAFYQMSGAGFAIQLLWLLITPILSRLYTPENFGVFGTLTTIISFISVIASLRFDFAFFIRKRNIEYFFLVSLICIAISALVSSIIISEFYIDYNFLLTFVAVLSISVYSSVTQFNVAKGQYKTLSKSRIIQGIVQCVLCLTFGFFYLPKGLIYAYISGQVASSIVLLLHLGISLKSIDFNKLKLVFRCNLKYALNSSFVSALYNASPMAPIIIGSFIYSNEDIGVFFLLLQAINAALNVPKQALINICTSELNTPSKFREKFLPIAKQFISNRIAQSFMFLFSLGTIVVHFFGEQIITFLLGDKWALGGSFIATLLFFRTIDTLFVPFMRLLDLWKKYFYIKTIEISRFLLIFAIIPLLSYFMKWDFSLYIFIHFLSIFVFNLVTFLCLIKASSSHFRKSASKLKGSPTGYSQD